MQDDFPITKPHSFPSSENEKAICAMFLSILSHVSIMKESDLLETLILAVHPDLCKQLLSDEDALEYASIINRVPNELFSTPNNTVYWKRVRILFEELNAIKIDRNLDINVIEKGIYFHIELLRFPINHELSLFLLKAQQKYKEIKTMPLALSEMAKKK